MKQTEHFPADKNLATFDGGLTLVAYKHLSTGSKISQMEQCRQYVVPLQQHIGTISQAIVKPSDRVLKGQMLAKPGGPVSAAVHAPVSGIVTAIEDRDIPHVSGLQDQCIIIENDFRDEWIQRTPLGDAYNQNTSSSLRK
ncbi:MAG: electron transport complex subunit RsxC, partial [Gammaproteobacteria bacterium]|nr:electron transport complex subunit RsxC [Gammaproteobacteria bacterium]